MNYNVREVSKVAAYSIVDAIGVDWSYWQLMPQCKLYEAVYLALNIDPQKIDFNRSESVEPVEFSADDDTQTRLALLKRWLSISENNLSQNGGKLDPIRYLEHNPLRSEVSISAFGNWAVSSGLNLPDEFPMQQQPDQPKQKPNPDQPTEQWEGFDPDDDIYPLELDIALQAWRAVAQHNQGAGNTPRQRLEHWISESGYNLKNQQISRIAIVCNWDKSRGRK